MGMNPLDIICKCGCEKYKNWTVEEEEWEEDFLADLEEWKAENLTKPTVVNSMKKETAIHDFKAHVRHGQAVDYAKFKVKESRTFPKLDDFYW